MACKGIGRVGGSGRRETAVDDSRKETADRLAKYQTDYVSRTCLCMLLVPQTAGVVSEMVLLSLHCLSGVRHYIVVFLRCRGFVTRDFRISLLTRRRIGSMSITPIVISSTLRVRADSSS